MQNGGPIVKKLIVNADDFGRTPGVNAGTLEAHTRGIVTSATVMVLERSAARGIREAGGAGAAPVARPALRRDRGRAPGGRRARRADARPGRLLPAHAGRASPRPSARGGPDRSSRHRSTSFRSSRASPRRTWIRITTPRSTRRSLRCSGPSRGRGRCRRAPRARSRRRALRAAGVRTPDRFIDSFHGEGASFEELERILREPAGRRLGADVPPRGPRRGAPERVELRRGAGVGARGAVRSGDPAARPLTRNRARRLRRAVRCASRLLKNGCGRRVRLFAIRRPVHGGATRARLRR